MSHFSVLVITREKPTEKVLGRVLQPWHEFECTGTVDQYVRDVDITEEVRLSMTKPRGGKGDDAGKPWCVTLDEALEHHGLAGSIVEDESEVDREDDHKWGWAVVHDGQLVRAVDRTNPDKRWDWWQLGGRFTGRLAMRRGGASGMVGSPGLMTRSKAGMYDAMLVADLDLVGMRERVTSEARTSLSEAVGKIFLMHPDLRRFGALKAAWAEARQLYLEHVRPKRDLLEAGGWTGGNIWQAAILECPRLGVLQDILKPITCMWRGLGIELDVHDPWARVESLPGLSAYAVVTLDGRWLERGTMGWFGVSSGEMSESDWHAQLEEALSSAGDAWVSIVDCHI